MTYRSFIDSLSGEQRDAALTTDDPVMIIAGAGSGKTRTLIARFMHLVAPKEQGGLGADPSSVMMVTFTNKAAREMRERIDPVLRDLRAEQPDRILRDPWIGTFHGISLRILRVESERAGLARNFSIFDEADARALAEDVAEGLALETFDVDEFFRDLELAKSRLLSASVLSEKKMELDMKSMLGQPYTRTEETWAKVIARFRTENFVNTYSAYQRALKEQNAVDFSDLMNTVTEIFRDNPRIRDSWRSTFRHFMVDEVQDMNRAQAAWMYAFTDGARPMEAPDASSSNAHATAEDGLHDINGYRIRQFPRPTVAFVGDDDQSIYAFRGSDISVMHSMSSRYEGLQMRYLNASYRCQPAILDAANALIGHNRGRFGKVIAPADPDREASRVIIERHTTPQDEIEALRVEIQRYMAGGRDPSEFAILLRTRDLVRVVAKELRAAGLPVVEGKASDIRRSSEVRDAMAFAGFLTNPDAETLLRRIINRPARGLGPTSISRVARNAKAKSISFIDELRSVMNDRVDLPEGAEPYGAAFVRHAKDFGRLIVEMRRRMSSAPDAGAALIEILELSGYLPAQRKAALSAAGIGADSPLSDLEPREFLKELVALSDAARKSRSTSKGKQEDVKKEEDLSMEDLVDRAGGLSETARRIGNLSILIEQARGFPDLESFIQEATLEMDQSEAQAGIRVMTIHGSKGLEFDRVRLPFWNEGIMPHARGGSASPEEIEEERRLAYVAITRARDTVRISSSYNVSQAPFIRLRESRDSSFLDEIRKAQRNNLASRIIWNRQHECYISNRPFDDALSVTAPLPASFTGKSPARPQRTYAVRNEDREFIDRMLSRQNTSHAEPDF